jgi:uncharacterized membrane protein HdeD (DUF308 family)
MLNLVIPADFLVVATTWLTLTGMLQVTNAYRLRSLFHHWKVLMLNGILAIIFSCTIIITPYERNLNKIIVMMLLGLTFIVFLIISSLYLRKLVEDIALEIPSKPGEAGNQELSYY